MNNYVSGRMHLFCDLDQTLINSLDINTELKYIDPNFQSNFKYVDMGKYYRVFQRPFLQEFLDYIFDNFNVSIFTAADEDYAVFILEHFILTKPERRIVYFLHNKSSELSEKLYNSPKDLRLLWDIFNLPGVKKSNTLIIDDLKEVADSNPDIIIKAPKFDLVVDKKQNTCIMSDTFLLSVIPLLEYRTEKYYNR